MAVADPVDDRTDRPSAERVVRLSAYVERPLDLVLDALAGPEVDELLLAAAEAAQDSADGVQVRVHASRPRWVSATHAKVAVAWSATAPDGGSHDGNAEVSLLVVRSGSGAITEVLVAFPVPAAIAAPTTTLLRAVLDRLSQLLEGRAV